MLGEINHVDKEMEDRYPNQYGGLYVKHHPEFRVVIKMTGGGEGLIKQITQNPVFIVEKAEVPVKQLKQLSNRVAKRLNDIKGFPFSVEPNIFDGKVDVRAPDITQLNSALTDDLKNNKNIRFIQDSVVSQNSATIYGGRLLSGTTQNCTSGFTITLNNTVQALLTAGHCDNTMIISGVTFNLASRSYQNSTEWGADMQTMTPSSGTHSFPNKIYNHSNTTMDITQVYYATNLPLEWPVCVYGVATNSKRCGKLKAKSLVLRDNKGITNAVFRVASDDGSAMNTAGDSGGPVFGAGAAYGLIKAKGGSTNPNDLYFVDIMTLESIMAPSMNPRVKISP